MTIEKPKREEVIVHVCMPQMERAWLAMAACPTCKHNVPKLFEAYGYFGGEATCLRCGERSCEDGVYERPFTRGWRKQVMRAAAQRLCNYGFPHHGHAAARKLPRRWMGRTNGEMKV